MKYCMVNVASVCSVFLLLLVTSSQLVAQDEVPETEAEKSDVAEAADVISEATEEIAQKVDQNEKANQYSAGILEPIYAMTEYMSFASFYWLAFAFMVSGVVSFALQLVLAKLAVLMRGGLSVSQILTDAQGLVISLVGLFLTTQAATENSTFTSSAAAVLSSALVGIVAGFLFYLWGQAAELQALKGRQLESLHEPQK